MALLSFRRALFKIIFVVFLIPITTEAASLDQVKMAFLFNFAQYASWPKSSFPSAKSPFTICLNATPDLITLLQVTVQGEVLNGRPFKIIDVSKQKKPDNCHILYISKLISSNMMSKVETATLLVSDQDGFAIQGGMIELQQQDQHLKLLINYKKVIEAGLSIRSNLLTLAIIVE